MNVYHEHIYFVFNNTSIATQSLIVTKGFLIRLMIYTTCCTMWQKGFPIRLMKYTTCCAMWQKVFL